MTVLTTRKPYTANDATAELTELASGLWSGVREGKKAVAMLLIGIMQRFALLKGVDEPSRLKSDAGTRAFVADLSYDTLAAQAERIGMPVIDYADA